MTNEPSQVVPSPIAKRNGNYAKVDHTGKRFGRLTATLRIAGGYNGTQTTYHCLCDCGATTEVRSCALTAGKTTSCGCVRRETVRNMRRTHGASRGRTYAIWQAMKTRCTNPNQSHWEYYGGRGIIVCPQWMISFEQFVADMGEAPAGKSIERRDPNKNYEPDNCCWATVLEQGATRRSNINLTHEGETLHVTEWSRRTGLPRMTICRRIAKGWDSHKILGTALRKMPPRRQPPVGPV